MIGRWVYPVDPECPKVMDYGDMLYDDPMGEAMGAPLGDFMEAFEKKHVRDCKRCQEHGMENVDVEY